MRCDNCKYFCKIVDGRVINDCETPKTNPITEDAENKCDNFYPFIDRFEYNGTITIWDIKHKKFLKIN